MVHAGKRDERVDPPPNGPEKELLEAFLDYHRDTLLMKCEGLSDEDPDAEFRIEESDSTESIIEFYKAECDKSRAIVAAANPEDIAEHSNSERSLRWILLHMIEETCRHNGHMDILREMIDGHTGE